MRCERRLNLDRIAGASRQPLAEPDTTRQRPSRVPSVPGAVYLPCIEYT
jgi:hypothetical protein